MATHVVVDRDVCAGTAECVRVAPDAFEIDEDQDVATVTAGAASTPLDQLRRAAYECPTGAITVEGDAAM